MIDNPICGLCGVTMTPENSSTVPEYFLCDGCAEKQGFQRRKHVNPVKHKRECPHCHGSLERYEDPEAIKIIGALEKERADMLAFIREQVALWDNAGDTGFPLYEQGKRILASHPLTIHV